MAKARVDPPRLRPGGGIAFFWNIRDPGRSAFLADYGRLLRTYTDQDQDPGPGSQDPLHGSETGRAIERSSAFDKPQHLDLQQEVAMTAEEFIGMAFTASYIRAGLRVEDQDRFRADLIGLLSRHGHLHGPFPVPYRIQCWIARRRGR